MATEPVKEPAASTRQVEAVTEPAAVARGRVYVYDTQTKEKLKHPVPRTWLDGRFPNLKEVPSTKQKEGN